MWACLQPPTDDSRRGFTIVELLIVIVVIAILAAVTIVAYNGISSRATVSSLQSDLENAAKRLKLDQVDLGTYPASAAAANGGAGLKPSAGTTYQYSVNNSVSPQTFCLTATKGTTSYYISNDGSPTSGGCAGHSVGGIPTVTNMAFNPAATSSVSVEWSPRYSMNRTWVTGAGDGPIAGLTTYSRSTQTSTVAGGGRGVDHRINIDLASPTVDVTWPVTNGVTITASTYVRSTVANSTAELKYRLHDGAGTWTSSIVVCTPTNYTTPNTWIRLTCVITPSVTGYIALTSRFEQSVPWTIGDTIDATGLLLSTGSTIYNYGDGNSSNWIWNGTTHNATSTGPPL
jgi:prepilin-type N-terminal cleavage/methylation domain-containing protein